MQHREGARCPSAQAEAGAGFEDEPFDEPESEELELEVVEELDVLGLAVVDESDEPEPDESPPEDVLSAEELLDDAGDLLRLSFL